MNWEHDEDDRALIELVRDFAARRSPLSDLRSREGAPVAFDSDVWHEFSVDLGLAGIIVPEAYGGGGADPGQALLIATELGAALSPLPFVPTALSATLALLSCPPGAARDEALTRIAGEGVIATVTDEHGGRMRAVPFAHACDLLIVIGDEDVRLLGPGDFATDPLAGVDITRRWARVESDPGVGTVIGVRPELTRAVWQTAQDAGLVADCAGGAREMVGRTVEYVRTREQFGRPVAGFQAVKHACADLWVDTEAIFSYAARMRELLGATTPTAPDTEPAVGAADPGLVDECAVARAFVTETYADLTRECLHLHGGIGFTWEHDAHLFLKRANASRYLFEARSWPELVAVR